MPRCAHCLVLTLVALLFVGQLRSWPNQRCVGPGRTSVCRERWLADPLRDPRSGSAHRDDPRLSDFWYLWRHHIEALSEDYQVVAVDQRGYNRSDKPKGVNNYTYDFLVSDIATVIRDAGHESATVAGHDWGGFVAWMFAMRQPAMTDQLVIFNLPHPRGLQRELAFNREQKQNSAYARRFQAEGAHLQLSAEQLARLGGVRTSRSSTNDTSRRWNGPTSTRC